MNTDDIREEIVSFLDQFISVEVNDDDDLFAAGLVNSLFAMQLVLFVEKKFSIKVENQDLDIANFRSVNTITQFVQRKVSS